MTNSRTVLLVSGLVVLGLVVLGASFFAAYRNRTALTPRSTPSPTVVADPANPCADSDGTQTGVFTSFETALATPLEVCGFLIAGQGITVLPPQIATMQNMLVLNVLDNKLTQVPPEIGQLKHLRVLILSGNAIPTLPVELGTLPNLQVVHLQGNPISAGEQARLRQQLPNVQFFF